MKKHFVFVSIIILLFLTGCADYPVGRGKIIKKNQDDQTIWVVFSGGDTVSGVQTQPNQFFNYAVGDCVVVNLFEEAYRTF